ncbi:NigD1/NigD2 family lipoprotein [Plebeiibacterium sediminum]|uniref:NigD-like C-terminal domain-containing protein n=1 Tax=Plebeiibacterium sediminum TaxID=2992112 RepID=A0AAE3SHE8_9BACT|nr:NigD-like C-terminal domain-containing protein [Plebeiobacterium sediminum]MCW3788148.1 hypothetical protein [Plebeiobacterium sediminum]
MKKLRFILPLLFGLLIFVSCDDDDDTDGYNNWWLTTGTVVLTDNSFYIVTDDGLNFGQEEDEVSASNFEDGMRLLFYYEVEGEATDSELLDYYIELKDYDEILTKPIFNFTETTNEEVIDSIGDDPIHIVDTWFTGDYLNVEFKYYGNNLLHYVNLVHDSSNPETENGEILLELKHNDNGDAWNYISWGVASFDISELQQEGEESVDIFVRSMGYYNEYEYNKVLTYEYSSTPVEAQSQNVSRKFSEFPSPMIK